MKNILRPAIVLFALLTVLTGLVYPVVITVAAQGLFPHQANGSLIARDGTIVGSELIGQSFTAPQYFWGRPSATGGAPYNAAASGGSNLGPSNPALLEAVTARAALLRDGAADKNLPIPIDLVTASGSGLDPHISPDAARLQVGRVAAARGLDPSQLLALVEARVERPQLGLLGQPRVNILLLKRALDEIQ